MNKLKYFFVDEQQYFIPSNLKLNLKELILYFNYRKSVLILEYNKKIYPKNQWEKTFIKNNDKIEILTLVGGG